MKFNRSNISRRKSHRRSCPQALRVLARRTVALCLAAALLHLSIAHAPGTAKAAGMKACGVIAVFGSSSVNGMAAISGQTVFSGSDIVTGQNSSATLSLGKLGRVELSFESSMRLDFGEAGIAGSLASGGVRVSIPAGVSATWTTTDVSVVSNNNEPTLFLIRTEEGKTVITAQMGQVTLRASGQTMQVAAGQSVSANSGGFSLDSSQPGGANNFSGKKAGIVLGIGGVITILIIALSGGNDNKPPTDSGGCVQILSPVAGGPPCS